MNESPYTKADWRNILTARRVALSPDVRLSAETAIRDRLFSLPAWKHARVILGYMSIRGEIDLAPVWQRARSEDKTYALPVTTSGCDKGRMVFRAMPEYEPTALSVGRFGIAEPPDHPRYPVLSPASLVDALILVPGLGFDRDGYRIGYGGGYYDRFLDALTTAGIPHSTVGLCFADCLTDTLPHETHDRAVSRIVSEHGVIFPLSSPRS